MPSSRLLAAVEVPVFQQHFWGYEITYPDHWVHATHGDVEAFALHPQALDVAYDGPRMGYLLIRAELNAYQMPLDTLWAEHLSRIAIMHGAKQVGSKPYFVGQSKGFAAELMLPRREDKRLWTAVLAAGGIVLHVLAMHRSSEALDFQPLISSLRYASLVSGVTLSARGMPLPTGSLPVEPADVFPDITAADHWETYRASAAVDALQIFYAREAPAHGWEVLGYSPYPNRDPAIQHASLVLYRDGCGAAVHLLPHDIGTGFVVLHHPAVQTGS